MSSLAIALISVIATVILAGLSTTLGFLLKRSFDQLDKVSNALLQFELRISKLEWWRDGKNRNATGPSGDT